MVHILASPADLTFRAVAGMSEASLTTYSSFWRHYLSEHSQPGTRRLHYLGTCCFVVALLSAVSYGLPYLAVGGIFSGKLRATT